MANSWTFSRSTPANHSSSISPAQIRTHCSQTSSQARRTIEPLPGKLYTLDDLQEQITVMSSYLPDLIRETFPDALSRLRICYRGMF
ncbi:hypothetical protein M514_10848 [Trichuris suis]|uniref:Uncharacterized protein n=1 Tax=Trichuris suis TaxID=68888 RepID=A0A085N1C9_9BILA|nr:hypothetical protein M513_10848 [Trichuris suis]KFD63275.1 hypothetical protein M514_10848 [Trichuris suis]